MPAKSIRPGQIPNHPCIDSDGNLGVPETEELQEDLISGYVTEEFQMKLYSGWYASDDLVEKHRWRQAVCAEVQFKHLPKYGFEASRTGVWASMKAVQTPAHSANPKGEYNYWLMEWLVNPDVQQSGCPLGMMPTNYMYMEGPREGERPESGYMARLTEPEDDAAVVGVARCQGALAGAHQALYKPTFPDLQQEHWFGVLGCRGVREALERGVVIYHAVSADTKFIAGFISCTCEFGGRDQEPHAKINNLVVLPQHRGHGIGKMLFDEMVSHLEQACPSICADLRISVAERNARAKDWYERLGFAVTREWTAHVGRSPIVFLDMQRRMNAEDFDDIFAS